MSGCRLELQAVTDGVIVPVRAQAKSRRTDITGIHDGRLKVAVTEPPERGKANDAIIDVLAEALGLRPAQVQLVTGAASPQKKFLVSGLTIDAVRSALAPYVDSAGEKGSD